METLIIELRTKCQSMSKKYYFSLISSDQSNITNLYESFGIKVGNESHCHLFPLFFIFSCKEKFFSFSVLKLQKDYRLSDRQFAECY